MMKPGMKVFLFFLLPPLSGLSQTAGGLSAYPSPVASSNLLTNPGFESGWTGWTNQESGASVFTIDTTPGDCHSGSGCLEMAMRNSGGYVIQNTSTQPAGTYDFSAWIKYSSITGSGVRLCLSAPPSYPWNLLAVCTPQYTGTSSGWAHVFLSANIISAASAIGFQIQNYTSNDSGTLWVDDVSLSQEQTPISVFMQYPNFKGMMFDDQSQTAVFTVIPNPTQGTIPSDATLTDYRIDGTVSTGTSCTGGTPVLTGSWSIPGTLPTNGVSTSFDFSSLSESTRYNVSFQMTQISTGANASANNPYPCYAIYKHPGSTRTGFQASVDQYQRILIDGTPTFLLGVYDSGGAYTDSESFYTTELNQTRRLNGLPLNSYLNYTMGAVPNEYAVPYLQALQTYGARWLQTDNCQATLTEEVNSANNGPFFWPSAIAANNGTAQARAAMPGFFGVYRADECVSSVAADTFALKAPTDAAAPGSVTFGGLLANNSLPLWRDIVDMVGTDPYPLYGAGATSLSLVSGWTLAAEAAVQNSRPVATVIQTFQFTSAGTFPTQAQLRNMSYMAIAEGANGLFWWSIGRYGGGMAGYQTDYGGISSVTKGSPTTFNLSENNFFCGTFPCSGTISISGATGDWAVFNGIQNETALSQTAFTVAIDSTSFSGVFNGIINLTQSTAWTNSQDIMATVGNPTLFAFSSPHDFTVGDYATFRSGNGSWAGLGSTYNVTVVDSTHISVAVNTTGFPAFSGIMTSNWPARRVQYYTWLQSVMTEIAGLQTVLASLDDNRKLISNTQQSAGLHTRVKTGTGGKYYLIASNTTGNTLTPTFTWADPIAGNITVYSEGYSVTPSGATFSDSFGPYAAHVYEVTDSRRSELPTEVRPRR
jgi:hypothetical protein